MSKCVISIKTNYPFNTLKTLNSINISIYNIKYKDNKLICVVNTNDVDNIKRRLLYNEIVIIKY